MARYPYPNVPMAPGVPQVVRSPTFPNTTPPTLGTALALGRLALALTRAPKWGIFRDFSAEIAQQTRRNANRQPGEPLRLRIFEGDHPVPVLVPDSFREFGNRQEWSVTNSPTEAGGFASYNKVNNPYEVQIRLTKGGSLRERTEFLQTLDKISGSLDLYRIVTPEKAYLSVTINRYEVMRKQERGAYFLDEVDIFFTEIRTVISEYSNTTFDTTSAQQAEDEPTKNYGTKQAVEGAPT